MINSLKFSNICFGTFSQSLLPARRRAKSTIVALRTSDVKEVEVKYTIPPDEKGHRRKPRRQRLSVLGVTPDTLNKLVDKYMQNGVVGIEELYPLVGKSIVNYRKFLVGLSHQFKQHKDIEVSHRIGKNDRSYPLALRIAADFRTRKLVPHITEPHIDGTPLSSEVPNARRVSPWLIALADLNIKASKGTIARVLVNPKDYQSLFPIAPNWYPRDLYPRETQEHGLVYDGADSFVFANNTPGIGSPSYGHYIIPAVKEVIEERSAKLIVDKVNAAMDALPPTTQYYLAQFTRPDLDTVAARSTPKADYKVFIDGGMINPGY